MSETRKAGVVTELVGAVQEVFENKFQGNSLTRLGEAMDEMERPDAPGRLDSLMPILDLVATWPPELREVVPLVEALTPQGKALLPAVLRGMAAHPGDCAALEASMGPPVSTAAKVAAWAGGLSDEELKTLDDALESYWLGTREASHREAMVLRMLGGLRDARRATPAPKVDEGRPQ